MTALLVEQHADGIRTGSRLSSRAIPDIEIKTYSATSSSVVPDAPERHSGDAFAFFLIDPKGWRIRSEAPPAAGAAEVGGDFQLHVRVHQSCGQHERARHDQRPRRTDAVRQLAAAAQEAEENAECYGLTPDRAERNSGRGFQRKPPQLGGYDYVADTTVLRPLKDRPLYCLIYATRHERGIAVFRDCQVAALIEQSKTRAERKVRHAASSSGQTELFESMHDMGPNETAAFLERERKNAEATVKELSPASPDYTTYRELWPAVLARHVVRPRDVNAICAGLRKRGELVFPDWEPNKRVPQDHYRIQRA